MTTVPIELDDELVTLLQDTNQPAKTAAREIIIFEFYRRGAISSGKAAELLGISRWEFVAKASQLGIPFFDMLQDEWEAELGRSRSI